MWLKNKSAGGISTVAVHLLPKQETPVRFWYPAQTEPGFLARPACRQAGFGGDSRYLLILIYKKMKCFFCEITDKKKEDEGMLFENDNILIMLDIDWATKGHTLVAWKKHIENCSDLDKKEFAEFSENVRKTEKILLDELQVDKAIILKSGGLYPHLHFHIYPISKETSWDSIKDMFDKKVKYEATKKEKDNFIISLRKKFEASK